MQTGGNIGKRKPEILALCFAVFYILHTFEECCRISPRKNRASISYKFEHFLKAIFSHAFGKFGRIVGHKIIVACFGLSFHQYIFILIWEQDYIEVKFECFFRDIGGPDHGVRYVILIKKIACPAGIHIRKPTLHQPYAGHCKRGGCCVGVGCNPMGLYIERVGNF